MKTQAHCLITTVSYRFSETGYLFNPDLCASMRVVITSATAGELTSETRALSNVYNEQDSMELMFHQSGVGMLSTAVSLTRMIENSKPHLVIQAGIGGCFDENFSLGNVVTVKEEYIADIGVEEELNWKDIFDLNLESANRVPFEDKALKNEHLDNLNFLQLPEVTAITINEITTRKQRVQQLKEKYNPVIESMEGAALHYVCKDYGIPFIQIRSISNYIAERNKSNWKLKEAIENLNHTLINYIHQLYSNVEKDMK